MTLVQRLSQLSILRFAVIGGLGMPVDAGVLYLMINWAGIGPRDGRLVSWLCAASFTWMGNRYFTFRERRAHGMANILSEWLRFLGANAVGGAVNVGIYEALVSFAPHPWNNPYLALVVGVLGGLLFNFTLSKKLVFKGPI